MYPTLPKELQKQLSKHYRIHVADCGGDVLKYTFSNDVDWLVPVEFEVLVQVYEDMPVANLLDALFNGIYAELSYYTDGEILDVVMANSSENITEEEAVEQIWYFKSIITNVADAIDNYRLTHK
jgi:hypothetical protein